MDRLTLVQNHLSASASASTTDSSLTSEDPKQLMKKYRSKSTINADVFRKTIYGHFEEFRASSLQILAKESIFKPYTVTETNRAEQRKIALQQMKRAIEIFGPFSPEETKKNPTKMAAVTCCIYGLDAGLATKISVHFLLYSKTIMLLGSDKHQKFADDAYALNDLGCFALTELTHGTNVNGIRTRADYNHTTREFVINTPAKTDMKIWIGGAAHTANMCVVMAQLYIGEKNYGVHPFIVPIRKKDDHTLLPGVLAGDCGLKVGLNSLDNGFLIFQDVRIPYDNMLDKFSSIDSEGNFQSPIKSASKRFAFLLGALGGGRLLITKYAVITLTNALTVATRFATVRRQFGTPGKPETNILEYPLTQYRLMPYLADLTAINCGNYRLYEVWAFSQEKMFDEDHPLLTEVHALTSTLKPMSSWLAQKGIQESREICGGLGYSAYNRLGAYREENDINTTWEGDNNVLLQQTAKFVLDCFRKVKAQEEVKYPSVYFLTETPPEFESTSQTGESPFAKDGHSIKKAFEVRANMFVHICAERLQQEFMDGKEPMDIWNGMQVFYLQNTAKAYTELYMLNEFRTRIEECKDVGTKKVFEKLYELYGYNNIERGATFLLEIGYINRKDLSLIRQNIVTLCREIKDEANGIIDALTVPDDLIVSPLGASDGDIYNRFITAVWTAPGAFERPVYWRDIKEMKSANKF